MGSPPATSPISSERLHERHAGVMRRGRGQFAWSSATGKAGGSITLVASDAATSRMVAQTSVEADSPPRVRSPSCGRKAMPSASNDVWATGGFGSRAAGRHRSKKRFEGRCCGGVPGDRSASQSSACTVTRASVMRARERLKRRRGVPAVCQRGCTTECSFMYPACAKLAALSSAAPRDLEMIRATRPNP